MRGQFVRRLRLLALCGAGWAMAGAAEAQSNVMFIFDASGSMVTAVSGANDSRIGIAKKAMVKALSEMPPEAHLGLMMYGHRRAKDCTDLELVSPLGADDAAAISKIVQAVQPKGETPIAAALRQAARSFTMLKGQSNSIVLVTDGIEECKGDPCAAANEIRAQGIGVKIDIVGFTLNDAQRKAIQCVPDATGGQYFEAKDLPSLNKALGAVRERTAQAAPPPAASPPAPPASTPIKVPVADDNLLSAASGGRLLMAPSEKWTILSDGKGTCDAVYAGEGVWGFKDGKPATFDAFEVLIPGADQYNMKDLELFVGDDGPLGAFRSVGTLTVQNIKMMNSPYQRFTLPPTTGRYIKVEIKSDWGGGYARGCGFRLHGKVDDQAAAVAKPAAPGIDLLAPANGGTLVASPNVQWDHLTDGQPMSGATYSGEGVWSFKDGRPATFDQIGVLIEGRDQYNLKEFEVFAGDEGPTGAFRSLGKFTTANGRLFETPYQPFPLPPTTARFLKVVFLKDWGGGYISGRGLRLYGKVDSASAAPPPAAPSAGIDLIAPGNGGLLLAAPNDDWKKLTEGKGEGISSPHGGEGIWAFKDEKPATINEVGLLIPFSRAQNVKDFEVFVSDDSPTGPFRSIGTFTTYNGRILANGGYQRFTLPTTKARYFKIAYKTDWGGEYINVYGLKVMGSP